MYQVQLLPGKKISFKVANRPLFTQKVVKAGVFWHFSEQNSDG